MRRGMFANHFFKQNDTNISEHYRRPYNAYKTYPVFAFPVSVNSKSIKWAKENGIYPYSCPPPGRAGHQYRVKIAAIPVYQVHQFCGRPNRVLKIIRVGNDQLLHINNISDKKQVDTKKYDQGNVNRAFG